MTDNKFIICVNMPNDTFPTQVNFS